MATGEVVVASSGLQDSGIIQKWDLNTGLLVSPFHRESSGPFVFFPPDDSSLKTTELLALNDTKKALLHYQLGKERPVHRFFGQDQLVCLAISPDGRYMVAGTGNGKLLGWEIESGQMVFHLPDAHLQRVNAVRLSTDGFVLVSASSDGSIKVWSWLVLLAGRTASTAEKPLYVLTEHRQSVTDVYMGFGLEGNCRMLSASEDGSVLLWDLVDGQLLAKFIFPTAISCTLFNSLETVVLAGGTDGIIYFIDLADNRIVNMTLYNNPNYTTGSSQDETASLRGGHQAPLTAMAFSLLEDKLITGDASGKISVWSLAARQIIRQLTASSPIHSLSVIAKESCEISTSMTQDHKSIHPMDPPKRASDHNGGRLMAKIIGPHRNTEGKPMISTHFPEPSSSVQKLQESYSRLLDFVFTKYSDNN